jgi:hypothetical protein
MRPQTEAAYHTRGCSSSLDLIVATRRGPSQISSITPSPAFRVSSMASWSFSNLIVWDGTQDRARVVQAEDSIFHEPLPSYRRERDHSQPPMPDYRVVNGDTHIYGGRSSQTLVSRCTNRKISKRPVTIPQVAPQRRTYRPA